jgi:hypothetical protein
MRIARLPPSRRRTCTGYSMPPISPQLMTG